MMVAINILIRGVAYVVLAGALLATAVALSNRQYPRPSASNGHASRNSGSLDIELARCKTIGAEAAQDTACQAAWKANRERFLGSTKRYQDRVSDTVAATVLLNQRAAPSVEGQPPSRLQAPPTPHSDAPDGTAERSE